MRRRRVHSAVARSAMAVLVIATSSLSAATVALGQGRVVLAGIVDAELWSTDSGSRLVTRNNGHVAPVGRLQLWAGVELNRKLQLLALGRFETGDGRPRQQVAEGNEFGLEQIALRYAHSAGLTIDAGKLLSPVGTFALRHLSTTNPLIGSPDGYSLAYPWGVQVSGANAHWDYRVALIELPVTNTKYMPEPGAAPRFAVGAGFTPGPSMRVGASFTRGPYLHSDLTDSLAAGTNWQDYQQEIVGFDARFSRGYLDIHGELAFAKYDVPGRATPLPGRVYYADVKYTWSSRVFTAARFESSDYGLVRPRGAGVWMARTVGFHDVEVGVGYRLDPRTTVKLSYRADNWDAAPSGRAVAFQVSHRFDVMSWFEGGR